MFFEKFQFFERRNLFFHKNIYTYIGSSGDEPAMVLRYIEHCVTPDSKVSYTKYNIYLVYLCILAPKLMSTTFIVLIGNGWCAHVLPLSKDPHVRQITLKGSSIYLSFLNILNFGCMNVNGKLEWSSLTLKHGPPTFSKFVTKAERQRVRCAIQYSIPEINIDNRLYAITSYSSTRHIFQVSRPI